MYISPRNRIIYHSPQQAFLIFFGRHPEYVWELASLTKVKFRNNIIFPFKLLYSWLKWTLLFLNITNAQKIRHLHIKITFFSPWRKSPTGPKATSLLRLPYYTQIDTHTRQNCMKVNITIILWINTQSVVTAIIFGKMKNIRITAKNQKSYQQECTNFQKIQEPPQNCIRQNGDMKHVP